ncbi:MAG: hypothetical protein IPK46_04095 [Saprospiraceae bacterium]|nr:hypothetical protein [Saprospiraceae bacterium]
MKWITILYVFLASIFCCIKISGQVRLIGDSNPNLLSVVKTYPTGIYAIGSITLNGIPHATFTKFNPSGHELWSVRLSERSQFTDFEATDNGFY